MNNDNGKPDPEQGLYRKYNVERLNDPTGKHRDCIYYVLDLNHDRHAVAALEAYAASCAEEYPTLAFDLRHTAASLARKLGVTRPEAVTPHERGAMIEAVARALCRFSYADRSIEELVAPSRQLWQRLIPEAEVAVSAMLELRRPQKDKS